MGQWRRHWWGRQLFPQSRGFRWKLLGVMPETGVALVWVGCVVWVSAEYVQTKGHVIRAGHGGAPVAVARAEGGSARPARLLGTSGSFVFVWWPDSRVAEAIPIETLQGLASGPATKGGAEPAPGARPAAAAAAPTPASGAGASADAAQAK